MQWQRYHKRFNGKNCVWCTCERKRFPWSDCVGCTYERKRLAGTDCVGCTCDRKQFRRIIVFFSSTVRISVFERSPVAHDLIFSYVCARRAYPRRFLGHVGRTPLSPTLTWRRFQMSARKGVKNVCLGPTRTSVPPHQHGQGLYRACLHQ